MQSRYLRETFEIKALIKVMKFALFLFIIFTPSVKHEFQLILYVLMICGYLGSIIGLVSIAQLDRAIPF